MLGACSNALCIYHSQTPTHKELAKSYKIMGSVIMHYINFAAEFHQICALFADITEFSIGLESSHLPQNVMNADFEFEQWH